MTLHPLAGKPAPAEMLIDVDALLRDFEQQVPNLDDPSQLVSFGTSGHRSSSENGSFTGSHIPAITQAICDYRKIHQTEGPLFMGKDTHALSETAQRSAIEVLAANGVQTFIQEENGYTPTPVISHAILCYNWERPNGLADGIVITPSHKPPSE